MATCSCGKRMSKWAPYCRECARKRSIEQAKKYVSVDKAGKCPGCGGSLSFNNSLAGTMWLQCLTNRPACNFQILADRDLVGEAQQEEHSHGKL